MEEGRNIPLIIMLSAGTVISIACIVYKFSLLHTLGFVLATLIVFYIIGLIIKRIIVSINKDAEERAKLLIKEEEEAKQKELAESKEVSAQETTVPDSEQQENLTMN